MHSTVMFIINRTLDSSIHSQIPWDFDTVDAEEYFNYSSLLEGADARIKIGANVQYSWNSVEWSGDKIESLALILDLINEEDYKLSVLCEGHLFQSGLLVL
jgi:hypothetical protein